MVLDTGKDFKNMAVCTLDDLPREGCWAILTKERTDEGRLKELSAEMGDRLSVQEIWKELLPEASLLISSAICGGDLRTRFQEAARERRCCLLLEPIRMRFPLPCLDGCGETIVEIPEGQHFYSDALCCYYAHTPTSMTLWDTEESLQQKVQLAKEAGFLGVACK